jgi:hypothetical protein
MVMHTITYFITGVAALVAFDYARVYADLAVHGMKGNGDERTRSACGTVGPCSPLTRRGR